MGTSPSNTYATPSPLPITYGPFSDKFMYKYLSRLLASVTSLPSPNFDVSNETAISNAYKNQFSDAELFEYLDHEYKTSNSLNSLVIDGSWTPPSVPAPNLAFDPATVEWSNNSTVFGWPLTNSTAENCSDSYYGYCLPLPYTIGIILAGTLLSIITVGGNIMVMAAFKLERQLQTISNYFLFSLAVADLTIGLISIPLMTFYTAKGRWQLGYTTCQLWLSIDYLMSNASVLNLLLISFDRYFSVTRPLTYRPRRTSKKAMVMIACAFLVSLLLWPPLIIAWPYIEGEFKIGDNECIVQFLLTNPAVTLGTATAAFYGPVLIMITLYSRVYCVTRTRQRELIKLQAFHQQSIRRTISSNSDARIPLRNTLSTASSVALGQRVSSFSKMQRDESCPMENEIDLTTMFYNASNYNVGTNNRSSPSAGRQSIKRNALQRVESDSRPWGFQALVDHFTRPKPIPSVQLSRHASLVSSGFEDEESISAISMDTTTYVGGEEAVPLRHGFQRGQQLAHEGCSPSPSDYGSTLANQFISHVRQSFSVPRKSKVELTRSPTTVPPSRDRSMSTPHSRQSKLVKVASMLVRPHRYYQQRQQQQQLQSQQQEQEQSQQQEQEQVQPETSHKEALECDNASTVYNPANSPIPEIRRISAVARISAKCAGVTKSAPTPSLGTRLKAMHEEDESVHHSGSGGNLSAQTQEPRRSISTPAAVQQESVYNVLIKLGKPSVDNSPAAQPPPPREGVDNGRRKLSRCRPVITVYNSIGDHAHLSPDRATSTVSSFSTADISSAGVPSVVVRRLSSGGSAASDPSSPAHATTPLVSAPRKRSHSSSVRSKASSTLSSVQRAAANRLSTRSIGAGSVANASLIINSPSTTTVSAAARPSRRRRRGERRQQESKAARTLSAILLAFIITWAPYNFIVCIESFNSKSVPILWFTFSYYLCYLNSTINPFLYALCNVTFRRTFWRIMTLKWSPLRGHHHRPPHHQAAVALTAMAIAASNRPRAFRAGPLR